MASADRASTELVSLVGHLDDTYSSSHERKGDALLLEMEDFFTMGRNTERVRRFIEANDEAFALVVTDSGDNTDSEGGLRLYQLFQKYAALVEGIIEDFVATKDAPEADTMETLVAAIKDEWNCSENAYRLVCTGYITASLDYEAFVQFAEDLYGTTHYSMTAIDNDAVDPVAELSGGSYGFADETAADGDVAQS